MRPETGPMQFDEDWCGIFIRGDNALMSYVPLLKKLRNKTNLEDDVFAEMELNDLINILESANQFQEKSVQLMKPFNDCKAENSQNDKR